MALAAVLAALAIIAITPVEARQQCRASARSGGYWSWRLIDGRKCWYEGKPMLSKALLEWPARAAAQPAPDRQLASVPPAKSGDPLDAQDSVPDASPTFDALWRSRIEKQQR